MYLEEMGLLFIKHCSNLQRLSIEQLNAIKEEKDDVINELTAQKKIILEDIENLQRQFDINQCNKEIVEKAKELLNQISDCEDNSQQILRSRSTEISRKMLANRKEMNIQQAYEERSYQDNSSILNIIK